MPELIYTEDSQSLVEANDTRQKLLVQEKYSGLPMPMQNLLEALRQLKVKIQNHKNAFYTNIDSKFFSEALKQSKKVCDIISLAKTMRQSLARDRLKQMAPNGNFEAYEAMLISDVAEFRAKVFNSISSTRAYAHKKVNVKQVLESTSKEIEASEKFRARLVHLAQGPLSSLFEFTDTTAEKEEEDAIELINSEPLDDLTDLKSELSKKEEELHHFRFTTDKIYSELAFDAKKIAHDAIEAIKKTRLILPVYAYYELPKEVEDADNKLQREIALVLGTLTMDRDALDSTLRSIKLECESLKKSCEEEHVANTYKTLKEIQAMYASCSEEFVKTK